MFLPLLVWGRSLLPKPNQVAGTITSYCANTGNASSLEPRLIEVAGSDAVGDRCRRRVVYGWETPHHLESRVKGGGNIFKRVCAAVQALRRD